MPGKASRQYLGDEGVEDSRIFEGCYTLDYSTIAAQVECQKGERSQWRRSLSIDEDGFVFLMVANVNSDRQHDLLLESFSRVVAACPNSYLLLVGRNANQETIVRQSKGGKLQRIENIRSVEPVAFDALPPLFAASDAYVHSGHESYSTAVAYAAIAGLPIVTTPHVGAGRDYVIEGETGFLVDSEDVSGFADKMLLLARDRITAQRFGRNAAAVASKFTPEWAAEQLEKAVAVATGNGRQATHDNYGNKDVAK